MLELRQQLMQADNDVIDAQRLAAERLPPSVIDALKAELDANAAQIAELMGLMVEQEREMKRKAVQMGACTPRPDWWSLAKHGVEVCVSHRCCKALAVCARHEAQGAHAQADCQYICCGKLKTTKLAQP